MSLKLSLLGVIFCITLCVKGDLYDGERWGNLTHEQVPTEAFEAGSDPENGPVYIIKAHFKGSRLPGKYTLFDKVASVPFEGKEYVVDEYEFLLDSVYQFVPNLAGGIPSNAIVGGHSESGEAAYYICRTFKGENKDICIGRLEPYDEQCYVGYNDEEYQEDVFGILVHYV